VSPASLHLIRAARRAFPGPAAFLADGGNRARVEAYLADMTGATPRPATNGHSYGEMAAALIAEVVPSREPVDLLILAFSIHDLWPGRATATYLSHLCPGTPLSFAVCDQGSAAPFTGLRIIRDHGGRRALLIVVEQAGLPYDSAATPPEEHRGVAMLFGNSGDGGGGVPVTAIRQRAGVPAEAVPDLAATGLAELSADHPRVGVILGDALAAAWPGHPDGRVSVVPAGQPATGVWWHLVDELDHTGSVVAADYDPDLRYLCLAGFAPARGPATAP
jgi:hypothetical protein